MNQLDSQPMYQPEMPLSDDDGAGVGFGLPAVAETDESETDSSDSESDQDVEDAQIVKKVATLAEANKKMTQILSRGKVIVQTLNAAEKPTGIVAKSRKAPVKTTNTPKPKKTVRPKAERAAVPGKAQCGICCENFNETTHKTIQCLYCNDKMCRECVTKYCLSIDEPHCMFCRKNWNGEFLSLGLTKSFILTTLKKHREEVLFSKEKSLLPQTQVFIEKILQERVIEKEISELNDKLYQLRHGSSEKAKEPKDRRKFIKQCPASGCMGFLSEQWKCGVCATWFCSKCHNKKAEKTDDTHVCKPEDLQSVELINKETKSCPNCGISIFKITGCDQMWCTGCHVAFSWNTGALIKNGNFHNPHYYEYQRQGGVIARNAGDIPCGGLPDVSQLQHQFRRVGNGIGNSTGISTQLMHCLEQAHRSLNEYHDINGNRRFAGRLYNGNNNNEWEITEQSNRDLRIKLMMGQIDEEFFKRTIQQREKKINKSYEVFLVIDMLINTTSETFRKLLPPLPAPPAPPATASTPTGAFGRVLPQTIVTAEQLLAANQAEMRKYLVPDKSFLIYGKWYICLITDRGAAAGPAIMLCNEAMGGFNSKRDALQWYRAKFGRDNVVGYMIRACLCQSSVTSPESALGHVMFNDYDNSRHTDLSSILPNDIHFIGEFPAPNAPRYRRAPTNGQDYLNDRANDMYTRITAQDVYNGANELYQLITFGNKALGKIANRYNMQVPYIRVNWDCDNREKTFLAWSVLYDPPKTAPTPTPPTN